MPRLDVCKLCVDIRPLFRLRGASLATVLSKTVGWLQYKTVGVLREKQCFGMFEWYLDVSRCISLWCLVLRPRSDDDFRWSGPGGNAAASPTPARRLQHGDFLFFACLFVSPGVILEKRLLIHPRNDHKCIRATEEQRSLLATPSLPPCQLFHVVARPLMDLQRMKAVDRERRSVVRWGALSLWDRVDCIGPMNESFRGRGTANPVGQQVMPRKKGAADWSKAFSQLGSTSFCFRQVADCALSQNAQSFLLQHYTEYAAFGSWVILNETRDLGRTRAEPCQVPSLIQG